MKDHLGSIHGIMDKNSKVVSAQDYDAWGYLMSDRNYQSDQNMYKFTSKERDNESSYDYFVARYYDSRIGRWGGVEPKMEKYASWTPYAYSLDHPLILVDLMAQM